LVGLFGEEVQMGSRLSTLSLSFSLVVLFQEEFRLGALWCSYFELELELGGALSGVQISGSLKQLLSA
jgi:hypothetical protein